MANFDYVIAKTMDDAVHLLNDADIRSIPLAGGTDIYVALRVNPLWFDRLVDIRRIPELSVISQDGDQVSLGAAVTFSHAIQNPILQKKPPFWSKPVKQSVDRQCEIAAPLVGMSRMLLPVPTPCQRWSAWRLLLICAHQKVNAC